MSSDSAGRPKGSSSARPKAQGTRVLRVERAVREELAALLGSDVRDPGVAGAIVTRVEMAKDLRSARIHVRLLEGGEDAARRKTVVDALYRASGMLRSELTRRLALRFAPELHFAYDEGVDRSNRIEQLLAEIDAEKADRGNKARRP